MIGVYAKLPMYPEDPCVRVVRPTDGHVLGESQPLAVPGSGQRNGGLL